MAPTPPDPPPSPKRSLRDTDAEDRYLQAGSSRLAGRGFVVEQVNPAPRFTAAAYRVPPALLLQGARLALGSLSMNVVGAEEANGLLFAKDAVPGSPLLADVTAHVEPTPSGGAKVRLAYDRPPGTKEDPAADERRLRALLASIEEHLERLVG